MSSNELTKEQKEKYEQYMKEQELFYKERFEKELKSNRPKPPWVEYPDIDRFDMFWRMGAGESLIIDLGIYFEYSDPNVLKEFKKKYPEPKEWSGWYDEP